MVTNRKCLRWAINCTYMLKQLFTDGLQTCSKYTDSTDSEGKLRGRIHIYEHVSMFLPTLQTGESGVSSLIPLKRHKLV